MTSFYAPADILRMVADFAELHHLDDDITSIRPLDGEAHVHGYDASTHSVVAMVLRWALALDVPTVNVKPESNVNEKPEPKYYRLTVRGKIGGLRVTFVALTNGPETEALHDMAIVGDLMLDQLAHCVREPEAVTA
ncbi:MAG: hypothetical protein QJR12_17010 [Mycobacterium sp.]|uniref:hypothetical protein n=1 Tax=Mycobacterium sp. TaxID=1785 RepID=UPI0026164716|nr:hypothetical protein [Mycobacterium sp.]MDI3315908.1 hypothetical protein [Mycobacterium sp.]